MSTVNAITYTQAVTAAIAYITFNSVIDDRKLAPLLYALKEAEQDLLAFPNKIFVDTAVGFIHTNRKIFCRLLDSKPIGAHSIFAEMDKCFSDPSATIADAALMQTAIDNIMAADTPTAMLCKELYRDVIEDWLYLYVTRYISDNGLAVDTTVSFLNVPANNKLTAVEALMESSGINAAAAAFTGTTEEAMDIVKKLANLNVQNVSDSK